MTCSSATPTAWSSIARDRGRRGARHRREIEARELAILTEALGGATIAEARAKHGYHLLQRHDS